MFNSNVLLVYLFKKKRKKEKRNRRNYEILHMNLFQKISHIISITINALIFQYIIFFWKKKLLRKYHDIFFLLNTIHYYNFHFQLTSYNSTHTSQTNISFYFSLLIKTLTTTQIQPCQTKPSHLLQPKLIVKPNL